MFSAKGDGKESETSSSSSLQGGTQPCRHFEFHEILQATHDFDESLVIGHGGFGKVYRGDVNNGSSLVVAAIKRLDSMSSQGATEFGLSKSSPTNQPSTYINTAVRGTFGYLDPDYYTTGKLTKKSDVYAFGVVLLEVLCRKRAVDRILDEEQWVNLAIWAQQSIKEGNLKHIIDSDLRVQISPKCLKEFVRIIKRCLQNNSKERSTMAEVVVSLESVLSLQEKYNNLLQVGSRTVFGRMVDMIPFTSNGENYGTDVKMLLRTRELPADYKIQGSKEFKFADLKRATNNFSPHMCLHQGHQKEIFLGWVDKDTFAPSTRGYGIAIAVKRFNQSSHEIPAAWQVEVSVLGRLIHPNIIRLLGYCNDKRQDCLLVHEYMQNKSLDSHLYPAEAPDNAIVGVPLLS